MELGGTAGRRNNSGASGFNICSAGLYTKELKDKSSDPRFDPNTHITRLSWQE